MKNRGVRGIARAIGGLILGFRQSKQRPTDGDALVFDADAGEWVPGAPGGNATLIAGYEVLTSAPAPTPAASKALRLIDTGGGVLKLIFGNLPVAGGGTGADNASDARTNLGLGSLAALSSVTADYIGSGAVTESKLGNGAVTADKLGTGAVTTAKLADTSVTTGKIDSLAVTTAKIAASAVTGLKIDPTAFTFAFANGRNGSGAVTVGAATLGALVRAVVYVGTGAIRDGSADFEPAVTVGGEIQQTAVGDLSSRAHFFIIQYQ